MLKENGSLSFQDIADTNGTQIWVTPTHGIFDFDTMASSIFTYRRQNDVTGVSNPTKIYKNMGNNQFTVVATFGARYGPQRLEGHRYDNDGDLDLYFHDNLNPTASGGNTRLFRNDGN